MARTTAKQQPAETLTGYFRRILKENPKLLNRRSNDELNRPVAGRPPRPASHQQGPGRA